MKCGDMVTVALQGDLGKPRPALVIQSDLFGVHLSVTILPVTSDLGATPLFRIAVKPTPENGLNTPSVFVPEPCSNQPACSFANLILGILPWMIESTRCTE